jgi:hypothetical protein
MHMKKQTILAAVFLALGMLAFGNVASAADTVTLNFTTNEGLEGTALLPQNFFGVGNPCIGKGSPSSGDDLNGLACAEMGREAVLQWLDGQYFEPRGGTEMIPPSGDHHRSGWRTMMVDHFSPGSFLTGFAPFLNQFPNFPQVGTPGPSGYDPDLLLLFLDHHGEPLTPGRFPRYIPHERQAWADTLMVKYVASSSGEFNQSVRSQVGQFRGDGLAGTTVSWMSMSNESTGGCAGGWCNWTFDVGGDGIAGTTDDILTRESLGTTTTVTSSLRVNSFFAAGDGTVDVILPLNPIEAVPTVIDDRLDQGMSQAGDPTDGLQVLRMAIQVVSGPNFHGEEGSDPYTWVLCGSRTGGAGEEDCDGAFGGIIDESSHFALIAGGAYGKGAVFSHAERFGSDGRFFTTDDGAGTDGIKGTSDDTIVKCTGAAGATVDGGGNPFWGANCDSDPGIDLVYGTSDDGVVYYREAVENGFRSGTRENRAFAFSFIDAQASLRELLQQNTAGSFIASCLNCNGAGQEHPGLAPIGPLNFDQVFPQIPPVDIGSHPPLFSETFNIVPAP